MSFDSQFVFIPGDSPKLKIRVNTKQSGDKCGEPVGISPLALVAASVVIQDITFTAPQKIGDAGNNYRVEFFGGALAGAEVVTVEALPFLGKKIRVQIEVGVSTAAQIVAALQAHPDFGTQFLALVSGVGTNTQIANALTAFTGGVGNMVEVTLPADPDQLVFNQLSNPPVVIDDGPLSKISIQLSEVETNQMIAGPIVVKVSKAGKISTHVVSGGVRKDSSAQGC